MGSLTHNVVPRPFQLYLTFILIICILIFLSFALLVHCFQFSGFIEMHLLNQMLWWEGRPSGEKFASQHFSETKVTYFKNEGSSHSHDLVVEFPLFCHRSLWKTYFKVMEFLKIQDTSFYVSWCCVYSEYRCCRQTEISDVLSSEVFVCMLSVVWLIRE